MRLPQDWGQEHPGRFLFCAALPLPDVAASIGEAVYALDTLKADGIKLATNVELKLFTNR